MSYLDISLSHSWQQMSRVASDPSPTLLRRWVPFSLMRCRTATTCARYYSVFSWKKMDMLKMVPSGSLILRLSGASLVVTRSVGGRYGTGGWLINCLFAYSKSFNPSALLRGVLVLVCCQSVVLSTSLLIKDLGGACRNLTPCMVAWKKTSQKAKFLVTKTLACANSARTAGWMAWYQCKSAVTYDPALTN